MTPTCRVTNQLPTIITISLIGVSGVVGVAVVICGAAAAYHRLREKQYATDVRLRTISEMRKKESTDGYDSDHSHNTDSSPNTNNFENDHDLSATTSSPRNNRMAQNSVVQKNTPAGDIYDHSDSTVVKLFFVFMPQEIWKKKKCYFPIATHIIDQATDIAVIFEFGQLYFNSNSNDDSDSDSDDNSIDCGDVDMKGLFILSCFAFVFYRIISSFWVYITTKSIYDALLQIFDLKIFHALYINFETNTNRPNSVQKYIQVLEASLESFPQIIIQFYYFLKLNVNVYDNLLVFISLIFSICNISSKMISEDELYFVQDWQKLNPVCCNYKQSQLPSLNPLYVIRFMIRLADVTLRVLTVLIIGIVFGLSWLSCYVAAEGLILGISAFRAKSLSVLVWIAQTPFHIESQPKGKILQLSNDKMMKLKNSNSICNKFLFCFGLSFVCCWAWIVECAPQTLSSHHWQFFVFRNMSQMFLWGITIFFYGRGELDLLSDDPYTASITILLYLFVILSLIVPFSISMLHYSGAILNAELSIDRTIDELLKNQLIEDIIELELFGMHVKPRKLLDYIYNDNNDSLWIRISQNPEQSLKAIEYLMNKGANINEKSVRNGGKTTLMKAIEDGSSDLVILLLNDENISLYERDDNDQTALAYSTKYATQAAQAFKNLNDNDNDNHKSKRTRRRLSRAAEKRSIIANMMISATLKDAKTDLNGHKRCGIVVLPSHEDIADDVKTPGNGSDGELDVIVSDIGDEKIKLKEIDLENNVMYETCINYCIDIDDPILLNYLVCESIPINQPNEATGATPLMKAIENGSVGVVKLLLNLHIQDDKDVGIRIKDKNGDSAWVYSWKYCTSSEIFEQFLILDSNSQLQDLNINEQEAKHGSTVLIYCVKELIKQKQNQKENKDNDDDDDDKDDNGNNSDINNNNADTDIDVVESILETLIKYQNSAKIEFDVNATNFFLETALMYAVMNDSVELVQRLARIRNININKPNGNGTTPLMMSLDFLHNGNRNEHEHEKDNNENKNDNEDEEEENKHDPYRRELNIKPKIQRKKQIQNDVTLFLINHEETDTQLQDNDGKTALAYLLEHINDIYNEDISIESIFTTEFWNKYVIFGANAILLKLIIETIIEKKSFIHTDEILFLGHNPLFWSVYNRKCDIFIQLMTHENKNCKFDYNYDMDHSNHAGQTIWELATSVPYLDSKLVEWLVVNMNEDIDINVRDAHGYQAWHRVCRETNVNNLIKFEIGTPRVSVYQRKLSLSQVQDNNGKFDKFNSKDNMLTTLDDICKVVKILVTNNAMIIDVVNNNQKNSIRVKLNKCQWAWLQLLVDYNNGKFELNGDHIEYFSKMVENGHHTIVQYLIQYEHIWNRLQALDVEFETVVKTVLMKAVRMLDCDMIEILLSKDKEKEKEKDKERENEEKEQKEEKKEKMDIKASDEMFTYLKNIKVSVVNKSKVQLALTLLSNSRNNNEE